MNRNLYFYELLTEKRSAANRAQNTAKQQAAQEARRKRTGKPTGSKRGKDSYDGRTLSISGKSGKPGTGEGGVEQRTVTGRGYDDEAYSESVNYENIYLELLGESVMNTYRDIGAILAEAMGLQPIRQRMVGAGLKRSEEGPATRRLMTTPSRLRAEQIAKEQIAKAQGAARSRGI